MQAGTKFLRIWLLADCRSQAMKPGCKLHIPFLTQG
jgi:hypothetical protein